MTIEHWPGETIPEDALTVLRGERQWAFVHGDGLLLCDLLIVAGLRVGHVITDAPYDPKTHANARTNRKTAADHVHAIEFDPIVPSTIAHLLIECAKRWAITFCATTQLGDYERATRGEEYVRDGFWHRTDSAPQITGDRPSQGCEGIAIMHRSGMKRWNGGGKQAFWEGPIDRSPDRIHPTKKPLWLMERLIEDFTDRGDVVLDPFTGEGTTGEACIRLGRRFIGCELDVKYASAAIRRISKAREQGQLWRAEPQRMKQVSLLEVVKCPGS